MPEPIFLFVFEGRKDESEYLYKFLDCLDIEINRIEVAYCTSIYKLYEQLNQESGLDTFELLKEFHKLKGNLDNYRQKDIASTYLFFDYDGHNPDASNNTKIESMLNQFNEETMQGKLYISYPMLESLRHKAYGNFADATSKIALGGEYKSSPELDHISYINNNCKQLIASHIKKANYLVNEQYEKPTNLIEQCNIFTAQLTKHINTNKEVSILSALPLFYLDYKGIKNIDL